ncbi:hypothetical protein DPMN_074595 [Dreissena polymorpha]|uniref:Uncharacterized protein n=1 Tax=Dreissena polymorpha TaxID=45954 RepID=A0A9D3YGK5_DREPO|nr:hypothetical protein DPMN_074595 [Dreissena polymorpha]
MELRGAGWSDCPSTTMYPPNQYVSTVSQNAPYSSNDPPQIYSSSGLTSVRENEQPEEQYICGEAHRIIDA